RIQDSGSGPGDSRLVIAKGTAEGFRTRAIGNPHVPVDGAGNRRRFGSAAADRCAEVGIVLRRVVTAAWRRQAEVVQRVAVDAAVLHHEPDVRAPRELP